MLSKEVVEILRCPKCRGVLVELLQPSGLHCRACSLVYAIMDGIPNLLVEDARPHSPAPSPEPAGAR